MKKYRLTKITVKTREIVSLAKEPTEETDFSICPICHSPLNSSISAATSTVATIKEKRAAELSPAEISDEQNRITKKENYK